MRVLRLLVLSAIVLLTGCASIPLTTALRLSTMNERTLFELDPQQIRVRVAVEDGFEVDAEDTQLTLTITNEAGTKDTRSYRLTLLQKTAGSRPGGIFHSDYAVVAYELALTSESVSDLRALQKSIASTKNFNFNLNVNAELSTIPDNAKSVRFWIDLKLRQSESYMVLFDGAQIELNRTNG
jgi:hypothetical protein